ncbi:HELZ [Bugula neritina]|uniref:HELZ n=1 Tax=Bugula neritina TaxID=10212 RepID=A0A7J7JD02_BUGNE|nr:HELZ [Bugula neritina]
MHQNWHPLTFLAACGESVQSKYGVGYSNQAEVFETVEFITSLVSNWPEETWGKFDQYSIGVVLPYMEQVMMVRSMLKQGPVKDLRLVSVERVYNVQGKQFRVVIINTVRTHHTCRGIDEDNSADYAFLSNSKLLNTAITRAQSLVVVVGDPFSLCTAGKCRNMWIKFLEDCERNKSLYGVTFAQIQDYMDYMDVNKAYKLNPLPWNSQYLTHLQYVKPKQLLLQPMLLTLTLLRFLPGLITC